MQIPGSELIAVGVFCSYFSIIAGLLFLILRSLPLSGARSGLGRAHVFILLALTSFAHTWFYMFKFMAASSFLPSFDLYLSFFRILQWSFRNYEQSKGIPSTGQLIERMSRWLLNTSLFEQAWASVCFGKVNWWWSQQLCLYTVGAWTIFLSTEGRRHQVKIIWAYMLLGQLVAISVASNLFYLALVLAGPPPSQAVQRPSEQWAPSALWIPVLVSLGTIATSPFTDDRTFLPNLLLMHFLIVIPLLVPDALFHRPQNSKPFLSLTIPTLYILVFVAGLVMHTRATSAALGDPALTVTEFAQSAWTVLHSHPAQSSIGWDVIWTSVSFVIWLILQPGQELTGGGRRLVTAAYLLLATPLVSVGVLAPHVLRPREDELQEKKNA